MVPLVNGHQLSVGFQGQCPWLYTFHYNYVNDLPDVIQSYVGIFADDTKIYRTITSLIDYDILQSDINSALQWCDVWLSF